MELKYANENIENRRIVERLKFSRKYYCSTLCVIPLVNRNCHGVILNQGNFICNYWKMLYYIHAYGCFFILFEYYFKNKFSSEMSAFECAN